MLRKIRETNLLVTFVGHKDMASRLHDGIQGAKRRHLCPIAKDLVAKATAGLAAISVDSWRTRVLD
jgi:hypothetical protein